MIQALTGEAALGWICGRSHADLSLDLIDVEETVVAKVLVPLTNLCELGLFQKMRIWELMSATLGFLYHPNIWIREGMCCKP